eukprot:COSAG01_NODE_50566_length_362_cov_0.828897_1_plen_50_part_01
MNQGLGGRQPATRGAGPRRACGVVVSTPDRLPGFGGGAAEGFCKWVLQGG